ncbi:MAG: hypothetical protein MRY78_18695 [Saprospiraceae bacterium]|nr:hypothetical protein [Saprospiraceae bacterium]
MAKKKYTLRELKAKTTALNEQELNSVKGGYVIISLPGKDLKAGNWSDIDLRLTTPVGSSGFFFPNKADGRG